MAAVGSAAERRADRPIAEAPQLRDPRHVGSVLRRRAPQPLVARRQAVKLSDRCCRGRGVSLWAMKIGVVGATGQVGTVMRQILAERNFPVSEIRYFASARSAGTTLDWKGTDDHRRGCGDRRRRPASTSPCSRPAPRRRASWRRSSPPPAPRHRQLVGMADGSRRAADRQRGQPRRDRQRPQGHHRQPQLHDDGGHAGAQAVARRGRSRPPDRRRRTRPSAAAASPASTSSTSRPARSSTGPAS